MKINTSNVYETNRAKKAYAVHITVLLCYCIHYCCRPNGYEEQCM